MNSHFHDKRFDEETNLKLFIFRKYLSEWLPVFLTKQGWNPCLFVNIFDFFAGPGRDSDGQPGSPIIIMEELRDYCENRANMKRADVKIRLFFNDIKLDHIRRLRMEVEKAKCSHDCCQIEYSSQDFAKALGQELLRMQNKESANLVFMDQFGVKEVTPEVLKSLASCTKTDIIFFISSSYIRRFCETPEFRTKFPMDSKKISAIEYNFIHRFICNYYREQIQDNRYYLAPFSIKKDKNIYGLVFGSSSLRGLEKFLKVCWEIDPKTGEANYNIDSDIERDGQLSIWPEDRGIKKIKLFQKELRGYIEKEEPDNGKVYEYCLLKGFHPPKSKEVLGEMQKEGELVVKHIDGTLARRGAFYLGYENYKELPKVRFSIKREQ